MNEFKYPKMNILSTQEAVEYLEDQGIKLTATQLAQIAKAGIFQNAEKDSQNRWRIPEVDLENYIIKSRKNRRRNWIAAGSIGAILTIVASIFTVFSGSKDIVDFLSTYVFAKRDLPKVEVESIELDFPLSWVKEGTACGYTIWLVNTSDSDTSLLAVSTELHIDERTIVLEPTKNSYMYSDDEVKIEVSVWKKKPLQGDYDFALTKQSTPNTHTQPVPTHTELEDFALSIEAPLPARIDAN